MRNILKTWLGLRASDDFIFEVCLRAGLEGWNELPPPQLEPRPHRELLRALTSVTLDIGMRKVDLHADHFNPQLFRAVFFAKKPSGPLAMRDPDRVHHSVSLTVSVPPSSSLFTL